MRDRDTIPLAGQILLDQIANLALIVDDQNVTVVVLTDQKRLPFVAVRPRADERRGNADGSPNLTHTYGYKFLHKIARPDIIG